jgi:Fe-S cluster biogenesis protein NfuA
MIHLIEELLDDNVRPSLKSHGGNVEIVDLDNYVLFVRLTGGCQGCSSSSATLKQGIEKTVKQHFPEIKDVVDITNHSAGENPYK